MQKTILITGVAGFIGFHVANKFLSKNYKIIGIDNFCKTYNPKIKKHRVFRLKKFKNFFFL